MNLTGFCWFYKGKREESAAVDQGKAKEDAKVQNEHQEAFLFMAEPILSLRFSLRPFTMPARRNGAPMKRNSSTSSATGAWLSSNRVGHGEQTAAVVDPLWPGLSLYGQLWWSTQASVGKLCNRALKVRCRGSWSGCCSPSVSQNTPDRPKRCKQNWKNCLTEEKCLILPVLPFFLVKCVNSVPAFFAELLYKSMKVNVQICRASVFKVKLKRARDVFRAAELTSRLWPESWWVGLRSTCWTSERSSRSFTSPRCTPPSRWGGLWKRPTTPCCHFLGSNQCL